MACVTQTLNIQQITELADTMRLLVMHHPRVLHCNVIQHVASKKTLCFIHLQRRRTAENFPLL